MSDFEFLSFLYSGRDRENGLRQYQGWNIWALCNFAGICFAEVEVIVSIVVYEINLNDKECNVLLEKQKVAKASEVLYTFCEVGGSLLVGVSSIYWNNHGWIIR